jgi:hypothetical protein
MKVHLRICGSIAVLVFLAAGFGAPAQAQVVSLTVGLTTSCPYGVPS